MILIADSGSTKTDWVLIDADSRKRVASVRTMGFNPYMQSVETMVENVRLSPVGKFSAQDIGGIFFYGAGCTPGEKSDDVAFALRQVFGRDCTVEVHSDMLGAARALCGSDEGIACILGTGSNSCLYDGRQIVDNVPPLGYVLGDEGSGAYLGKLLVGNVLKGQMPSTVSDAFFDEVGMTVSEIIDTVYRKPMPNRWLASLSPFILRNIGTEAVRIMVADAFTAFFQRNVLNYGRTDLAVGMVGSIAFYYSDIIGEVAQTLGLRVGRILKSPLDGLIDFHSPLLSPGGGW